MNMYLQLHLEYGGLIEVLVLLIMICKNLKKLLLICRKRKQIKKSTPCFMI